MVGLNGFIAITSENMDIIFPTIIIGYVVGSCLFPYVIPIYFIVVFSVSLVRRGVYGETHARNTLIGFFFGVFGMIVPPIIGLIFLMFSEVIENIYVIMPFFIHLVPISLMIGCFLFVKDIGGRARGMIALIIFSVSSLLLAITEFIGLIYTIEEPMEDTFMGLVFFSGMLMAIGALIGIIFMIVAFVDAARWTKAHKPLIDIQQKQQLEMQQNQIKMQIEQLRMQEEQLELQKRSMDMISDIKMDSIGDGRKMISHGRRDRDEYDEEWD